MGRPKGSKNKTTTPKLPTGPSSLEAKQSAILDALDEDLGGGSPVSQGTKAAVLSEEEKPKEAVSYTSAVSKDREASEKTKAMVAEINKSAVPPKSIPIGDGPVIGRIVHWCFKAYDNAGRSVLQKRAAIIVDVIKNDGMVDSHMVNLVAFSPRGDMQPRFGVQFSDIPAEGRWSWTS